MSAHTLKVVGVFSLAGLCSSAAALLLGYLYIPSLFFCAGLALFVGLTCAYMVALSCGWVAAAPSPWRYWEAAGLVVLGYPLAEVFGAVMSLFCEALLFVVPSHWHAAVKTHEPLPLIALLSFWGSLAAAFLVDTAVMVITDYWDKRLMLYLSIAGALTTAVAVIVYAPHYNATSGFAARYRELLLFGTLLPLGDVLFAALVGYGLLRAMPVQTEARVAVAANGES